MRSCSHLEDNAAVGGHFETRVENPWWMPSLTFERQSRGGLEQG